MQLDDIKTYETFDKEELSYGIEHLPEQVKIAWAETKEISFPASYKNVTHVVVVGMGGSSLGAHMIQSVFADTLNVPFELVRDYTLPKSAGKNTLVMLSSFSGTTEEVLHAAKEAKRAKCKCAVISAGGPLAKWAKRHRYPVYVFHPGELAKQPRLGTAFSMVGMMGMLKQAGVLRVGEGQVKAMMGAMGDVIENSSLEVLQKENPAKVVATELKDRAVMIVASEHLVGNAHTLQNQINENAKQIALFKELPELNHHLLEGLAFPKNLFKNFTVLLLRSELYHPRTRARYDITADVFEKQGGVVIDYLCGGKTKLEECGEVLQFGSFVSYYLAMLNEVKPEEIPYVDWFKEELKKKK